MPHKIINIDGEYLSHNFKNELSDEISLQLYEEIQNAAKSNENVYIRVEISNVYLIFLVQLEGKEEKLSDITFKLIGFPDKRTIKNGRWSQFQ